MTARHSFYPYLLLGILLFCWISFPKSLVDRARAWSVGIITPFPPKPSREEISSLRIENQHLRTQLEAAYEWLLGDRHVSQQVQVLKELDKEISKVSEGEWKSFLQRRAAHLKTRLRGEAISVPAQVIYRDPAAWSSSLWVNAGEEENLKIGQTLIAKNSPVLAAGNLVGVVDYVGKRQSRIRLITDAGLSPAVRAVRGAIQNREVAQLLETLIDRLNMRSDLFDSSEEKNSALAHIKELRSKIGLDWDAGYLAKGEIMGSSAPFWRSRGPLLKGVGFNFDYPDEEGKSSLPLLQEGDFLVTSGLDGVFPPGLRVGTVAKVQAPHSGGYAYEIEVRPAAPNLNDLQTVFILPPVNAE